MFEPYDDGLTAAMRSEFPMMDNATIERMVKAARKARNDASLYRVPAGSVVCVEGGGYYIRTDMEEDDDSFVQFTECSTYSGPEHMTIAEMSKTTYKIVGTLNV